MEFENEALKQLALGLTRLELELQSSIQDISLLGYESFDVLNGLNASTRTLIRQYREKLDDLDLLAEEQVTERDREIVLAEKDKFETQLQTSLTLFREANLVAQLKIHDSEKNSLVRHRTKQQNGNDKGLSNSGSNVGRDHVARAANEVTESMLNLSRMMTSNVRQSEATTATLVHQSKSIQETQDEFRSMSGHIQSSHVLLTKYKRRQCTDKVLIFIAIAFFFAVVLYVLRKRVMSKFF